MKLYMLISHVDARTLRVLCGDLLKEERIIVGLLFVLCLCVCFVVSHVSVYVRVSVPVCVCDGGGGLCYFFM